MKRAQKNKRPLLTKGVNPVNPAHLYEQIVEDIKGKIARGELKAGDRIDTQAELAKKYNVSLITVKNAIGLLANEGVLLTRARKGTHVLDTPMKRVDLSEHKTIGLVLRELSHPFFSMVVQSVEERAYELGYNVLLSGSSGNIEKEENQIERFRGMGVDGVVIASLSLEYKATDYIQRLHTENFPYVMVSYIHDPDFWFVGVDNDLGGFMAAEHLIRTGYRSVGYVHMGGKNLLSEVRKNGYARALMEYDLPYDSEAVFTLDPRKNGLITDRHQLGYQFGKNFKNIAKKPEALFFYNDMVAIGFIQGAAETGIRIPDDVAIVGFDDTPVARYAPVPLTTIHQPVDKIGRMAVEVVQKRIKKIDVGNRTVLKPSLIVRESCGAKRRSVGGTPEPRIVNHSA
ncbi:MAG TPA: GntR family transcriptional regulator [Bacteroidota bacterium]|nr:GntR family transcriptional regulator [Bacteroidota bacterium]